MKCLRVKITIIYDVLHPGVRLAYGFVRLLTLVVPTFNSLHIGKMGFSFFKVLNFEVEYRTVRFRLKPPHYRYEVDC